MKYVIRKGRKYMTGHSYHTGSGYKFSWTSNKAEARVFISGDGTNPDSLAMKSGGTVEEFRDPKIYTNGSTGK